MKFYRFLQLSLSASVQKYSAYIWLKFSLNPGMLVLSSSIKNPSNHQILLALFFIHIWFDKHTNNTALLMKNIYFLLKCYRINVIGCILQRVHEVITNWKHFVRLFVFGEYREVGTHLSFFLHVHLINILIIINIDNEHGNLFWWFYFDILYDWE